MRSGQVAWRKILFFSATSLEWIAGCCAFCRTLSGSNRSAGIVQPFAVADLTIHGVAFCWIHGFSCAQRNGRGWEMVDVPRLPLTLKGKAGILMVCVGSPFPFSLLPSQCGGAIRSLKTILRAGGIKVISVLRASDSFNFDKKKEHYLQRVRRVAHLINLQ